MRVLLRLRDTELRQAARFNDLSHGLGERLRRIGDTDVQPRFVLRHRRVYGAQGFIARKAFENIVGKGVRQLPRPIGAEIKENNAVLTLHARIPGNDRRNEKLVRYSRRVRSGDGLARGLRRRAFSPGDRLVSLGYALPALVAIHRVKAARHRGDAPHAQFADFFFQLPDISVGARRRHVPPVEEGVNPDLLNARALRHLQQRVEVRRMTVNAPRRDQTHQVERTSPALCRGDHLAQRLVRKKRPVANCPGDAGQFLIDDPTRADIRVTDLRVSHLPVGNPYRLSRAGQ